MYFDVYDYPNLVAFLLPSDYGFAGAFERLGFKTYRLRTYILPLGGGTVFRDWLDDEEFTWFVLRYS